MARKSLTAETKRTVLDRFDNSCANCGEKETYLEIHYIVPLSRGGTDNIGNLAPLCWKCHQLAHSGYNIREKQKEILKTAGGRKRSCSAEAFDAAFTKFINGEIGKMKFSELTGYKSPKVSPYFKEAMKRHGMASIRNNLDIAMTNRGVNWAYNLRDGDVIGCIEYIDGRKEDILYHNTGENDVSYIHRKRKHMAS